MVIWIAPFAINLSKTDFPSTPTPGVPEIEVAEVSLGGPSSPTKLVNSYQEPRFMHGWCELQTQSGLCRTSATLSGAPILDWPISQGLAGQVQLEIDVPASWRFHENEEQHCHFQITRFIGSPAQLLGSLASHPVERLRFSLEDMPIEIRPSFKDQLALLVIGDAEYLILTTPRMPGDRAYRRIARQLVLNKKLTKENSSKHHLFSEL